MKSATIEMHGKPLNPQELTLKQIEQVLQAMRSDELHPVEAMCPEIPVSALAIATSCGIDPDNLMDLTHTQVVELANQVAAANPSLARETDLLATLAATVLGKDDLPLNPQVEGEERSNASSTQSADPPAG